ncbi:MAG: MBL fold metallo-hydrolase [Steroidobacteraceae bacterium]
MPADRRDPGASPHSDGRFRNRAARLPGPKLTWKDMWDFFFNKPANTRPAGAIEVVPLTRAALEAAPDRSLFRLGHSTLLIKLRDGFWITDPVFAERASPVQWAGPKRFHAPPIALEDLPPLRGVVLSQDHNDHLEPDTLKKLAARAEVFLAPLGVGDRLIAWGVPAAKVKQFDWWQGTTIDGVQFTATPAQHFSGRGLMDGDKTLWASWVIVDGEHRYFFSGDGGYFDGFAEIGRRFGPFDVAMVETGAYDKRWAYVHMLPEETVRAHQDLRGRTLLPIHNGTFDLAMHAWDDPFERVSKLAAELGIALSTPRMGERVDLTAPQPTQAWWRAAT